MIKTNADELADFIERISDTRLESWVRAALGQKADSFADYVKECWLSGSPVGVVTGELRGSVKPYTPKKRIPGEVSVTVTKGAGVDGMLNYVARWNRTPKEFMRPAWLMWQGDKQMAAGIESIVEEQLKKS